MPVVSSLDHLPTGGEFYSNNCVDGHCIGCGECCTDWRMKSTSGVAADRRR